MNSPWFCLSVKDRASALFLWPSPSFAHLHGPLWSFHASVPLWITSSDSDNFQDWVMCLWTWPWLWLCLLPDLWMELLASACLPSTWITRDHHALASCWGNPSDSPLVWLPAWKFIQVPASKWQVGQVPGPWALSAWSIPLFPSCFSNSGACWK